MKQQPQVQFDTEHPRIALFYSKGPHFQRTLEKLRATWPEAEITAIIPAGYPLSGEEEALLSEVVETQRTRYTMRALGPSLRLLRSIRQARYDLFVVMFASGRLRLLAALSRARHRLCYPPENRIIPLRADPVRILAGEIARRILGLMVYIALALAVRILKVGGDD